ncbi:MAG: hypothetical protein L0211_04340 [Planctomycetaceae bacterium]|nr:hypothetical protein [Planctomycetaceae bacterium]
MRSLALLVIIAAFVLPQPAAQAAGRRRLQAWQVRENWVSRQHVDAVDLPHVRPLDPRAVYPKYQGGFHSRALQNIGVPTGDIGIRGNGFMMNPW